MRHPLLSSIVQLPRFPMIRHIHCFFLARDNPDDLSDVWCEEELLFDWATRAMGQAGSAEAEASER